MKLAPSLSNGMKLARSLFWSKQNPFAQSRRVIPNLNASTLRAQRGSLMVETSLILIPLLLIAGLILELTQLNHINNIARLALYDTGRFASVTHANPQGFEKAFKHAMLALFVPQGSHRSAQHRQEAYIKRHIQLTGHPPWKLEVLSPTKASFRDFADARLSRLNRKPTIRNDYQDLQHQQRLSQGWPSGRGPQSGQTVFEANTLHLKLTYLHRPLVPGLQAVLKTLGSVRTDEIGLAWRQGLFAVVLTHEVMMQSDVQDWW